ncbi:MAG: hypothetical protein IKD84_02525, partial [Erysipelotrichaceae bacterium]|nr:hypothetical protein [Erysipelotrichaceae bacterium]
HIVRINEYGIGPEGPSLDPVIQYFISPQIILDRTASDGYVGLIDDDLFMDASINFYDLTVLNIGQSLFRLLYSFPSILIIEAQIIYSVVV